MMLFHRALVSTLLLLSGSAVVAAFGVAPSGGKQKVKRTLPSALQKNLANAVAIGVISASALLPLAVPSPAAAADSLVVGTPLESKLANFGKASYPVFNSITDVSPLGDKFLDLVDKKIKAPDAAAVAKKGVDGLLAIPDQKVYEYRDALKTVYAGVSDKSCVTLGGSASTAKKFASSAVVKSVDTSKIELLKKKFQPANSAVPIGKDGNICLPGSVAASEKLWVAQAELTFSMPKAEAGALVASIKKAGIAVPRSSLASLVPAAEGVFSKSPEAVEMAKAGRNVEPNVIATAQAALVK